MELIFFITYAAVAVTLIVLVGVIKERCRLDEFEVMICTIGAMLWPIILPVALIVTLSYCLIKLGSIIGER